MIRASSCLLFPSFLVGASSETRRAFAAEAHLYLHVLYVLPFATRWLFLLAGPTLATHRTKTTPENHTPTPASRY